MTSVSARSNKGTRHTYLRDLSRKGGWDPDMNFHDTALIIGIVVVVQVPLALLVARSKLIMEHAHKRYRRGGTTPPREVVDAAKAESRRTQILTGAVCAALAVTTITAVMKTNTHVNLGFVVVCGACGLAGMLTVLSLESAKRSRSWCRQLESGDFHSDL